MMATGNPFTSGSAPAYQLLAPDLAVEQTKLQRQQQMADLLRQQSLAPSGPTQVVNGWAVKQSPLEGISKLGQALVARQLQGESDEKQTALSKSFQSRIGELLNGAPQAPAAPLPGQLGSGMADAANPNIAPPAQTGGAPVVNLGNAAPVPTQSGGAPNNFNMANLLRGQAIDALGGTAAAGAYWDGMKPTDMQKNDTYLGIGQDQSRASELAKRNKEGYIAPTSLRPGGYKQDADGTITQLPQVPEGAAAKQDANGNWVIAPVQGGATAISALTAAKQAGTNQQTLAPATMSPVNPDGTISPRTVAQTIAPNAGFPAGTQVPAPTQSNPQAARVEIFQQERAAIQARPDSDPRKAGDLAAIDREIRNVPGAAPAPQGVGMPLGLPQSIEGNVKTVNDHFQTMNTGNSNAPVELDALQNMKRYATGAVTGALADRREFVNGIKSLIPGWDSAMDAKTQTDLFNKNSARMTMAGSSGANATDAMRTLAAAANPNNKMSVGAINDAVDQLASIKKMNLAAQKVLEPLKISNNTQGYQTTLSTFNNNADPKIYQLADMNPQEQAKFVSKLSPAEAKSLMQKRATLIKMGAL